MVLLAGATLIPGALEDSAGGDIGRIRKGHSNEVDPDQQLELVDAGVPRVVTDSTVWTSAQVTARWPSEERRGV